MLATFRQEAGDDAAMMAQVPFNDEGSESTDLVLSGGFDAKTVTIGLCLCFLFLLFGTCEIFVSLTSCFISVAMESVAKDATAMVSVEWRCMWPTNRAGERASYGSRLHPDNCNPCIFWFKDKAGRKTRGFWDWRRRFVSCFDFDSFLFPS